MDFRFVLDHNKYTNVCVCAVRRRSAVYDNASMGIL